MRIALISEHASPLAVIGGVDSGGQNVHVAELAAGLVRQGHDVVVYTRRDSPDLNRRVTTGAGYDVVHVPAGHIGLIISRSASKITLPTLVDWLTSDLQGAS